MKSAAKTNKTGDNSELDIDELKGFVKDNIGEEIEQKTLNNFVGNLFGRKDENTNSNQVTKQSTSADGKPVELTTIFNEENKPVQIVKKQNGQIVSTTNFTYNDETENSIAHVVLETTNTDGSKVITTALETDETGNVSNEHFIDRTTIDKDNNKTQVYVQNGFVVENKVKADGKKVLTAYHGNNIEDYDSKKLHRAFQEVEENGVKKAVEYDGNGNTKTVVQNGESVDLIAQKFGVSSKALTGVNPKLNKNNLHVGQDILIPGEFNADSYLVRVRKDK